MSKAIANLLHQVLLGDQQDTPYQRYKKILLTNWPEISGKLSTRMRIERIHEQVIIIGVYDTAWMQELYCMSDLLLHKINQYLGCDYFRDLKFKYVNKLVSNSVKRLPVSRLAQSVKLRPVNLQAHELAALALVQDPELRGALQGFLERCYRER